MSPLAVMLPPAPVVTTGLTVVVMKPTLMPAPRPPLVARPMPWVRANTSLRTVTVLAAVTLPFRAVSTVPPTSTRMTTMPMPTPSAPDTDMPSAVAWLFTRLLTLTAPVVLIAVPVPTAALTFGLLAAVMTPPVALPSSAAAPRRTFTNVGVTVSPSHVGLTWLPSSSVFSLAMTSTGPVIEPPPTVNASTVGS